MKTKEFEEERLFFTNAIYQVQVQFTDTRCASPRKHKKEHLSGTVNSRQSDRQQRKKGRETVFRFYETEVLKTRAAAAV